MARGQGRRAGRRREGLWSLYRRAAAVAPVVFAIAGCGSTSDGERNLADASLDQSNVSDSEQEVTPEADVGLPDSALDAGEDADGSLTLDADASGTITVLGRVIDSNRQPAVGWPVMLNGVQTITDAFGRFAFANVAPPYDVAFQYPGLPNTTAEPSVWVYRGLTRPDPTLQPSITLGPRFRDVYFDVVNAPTPVAPEGGPSQVLLLGASFGAPHVKFGYLLDPPPTQVVTEMRWFGASSIAGTVHALAFTRAGYWSDGGADNQYLAYHEYPLIIADDPFSAQDMTLDYTPNVVPTAVFTASVQASWGDPTTASRSLHGSVVFDSTGFIEVVSVKDAHTTSSVTASMPLLPGSHVVFVAFQTTDYLSGFGMARHEAASPADKTLLDIPPPRDLISPDNGDQTVNSSTNFEWSDGSDVSVFSVECGNKRVQVVSLAHTAQLPSLPELGTDLPKATDCYWHVEVHGPYATVDDATGPNGMIEPCFYDDKCDRASLRGDGQFTMSKWRKFQLAP